MAGAWKCLPGASLATKSTIFLFLSELQSQVLHFNGADTGPEHACSWTVSVDASGNIPVG